MYINSTFIWVVIKVKRKTFETEEEEDGCEKKYRKCEKAGCTATHPVCFASASERQVNLNL